jgi:hypothetical protein
MFNETLPLFDEELDYDAQRLGATLDSPPISLFANVEQEKRDSARPPESTSDGIRGHSCQ